MPSGYDLDLLHAVLQVAFDWRDLHPHCFDLAGRLYEPDAEPGEPPHPHAPDPEPSSRPTSGAHLHDLFPDPGGALTYEYRDLDDSWLVEVAVERILPASCHDVRCLSGAGTAPPDDVGGPRAWQTLHDLGPTDRPHRGTEQNAFDLATLNRRLLVFAGW